MAFVSIRDLKVSFSGVQVLHGINIDIDRGETLGLVGESGCGKSVTWLAALGLLPGKTSVSGSVRVDGQELINAPRHVQEGVRGGRIAMIFQDPSSSLNPVKKVGPQIVESLSLHRGLKGKAARLEAIRLMERVGIPDAARRFDLFPHEFSGGQCQRIMIAIALAGEPDVLIADEPTTALDVTIQAQILDLLNQIRQETGMAIVFISHDLGAVSQICERVCVMYAGRIVETAQTSELFETPKHPYTLGLFDAIPRLDGGRERLRAIPGTVPDPRHLPQGCAFAPRCSQATEQCEKHIPELRQLNAQKVACFNVVDVIKTTFIEAGNAHRTIGAEGATA
ncbi:ABC transporter ATP-binding protein [Ochrobactrum quorumnocens]|uniref:ABC transporter ATP-binding protein n=1 Tax=Ochrobactrum quorumnocens TaxID=271865 RepID=A0A248ULI5_9HYPH|nr:ABC transporter ATP-binding protein [[Ochrobactrum] quorumnocens]ASV87400.1 oligopeptide/dipeptide ABC transporter, ATP-binding, C-terminal domain protein [[Ochrobactrum] quorumnocens]KAA9369329.1 ABC transporter ATP-binding protein [[Ochrobactrum] quorumnocens]MBD7991235.1 ABC transporter ATP-binding protein [Ochrobactrum gallinarum]